jgi:hypothetical protein
MLLTPVRSLTPIFLARRDTAVTFVTHGRNATLFLCLP